MVDHQRYTRQMIMPQFGNEGQQLLSSSKVLIVGAGGIGSTVALFLAASGVPSDVLDFDLVEISNLHRQIIHDESQTGIEKAISAVQKMTQINSTVSYNSLVCKLTSDNAMDIIQRYDLVVDATDNIDARYTINDCCVLLRKPFISGSAVSMDGQITTVIPYTTPCYRCLYPSLSVSLGSCRSCADAGVLGPIPGLIGCLEAIEAIKLLLNRDKYIDVDTDIMLSSGSTPATGTSSSSSGDPAPKRQRVNGKSAAQLKPLLGRQVLYDAVTGEFHTFQLPPRNAQCAVCGDHPTVTNMQQSKATLEAAPGPVCAPLLSTSNSNSRANSTEMSPSTGPSSLHNTPTSTNDLTPPADILTAPLTPATVPLLAAPAAVGEQNRVSCQDLAAMLKVIESPEAPVLFPHSSRTILIAAGDKAKPALNLILDVRTAEQFSITRLNVPHVITFASHEESAALEGSPQDLHRLRTAHAVQVNVPLSVLKGGRAASDREINQRKVVTEILRLRALLAQCGSHHVASPAHDNQNQARADTRSTHNQHVVDSTAEALKVVNPSEVGVYVLCRRGIDSVTATQLLLALGLGPEVYNVEGGLTAWSKQVDTSFSMY